MLTETQKRFVALEKKKADIKKLYDELDQAIKDVVQEIGVNSFFQDDEGTVYKTVVPQGTFVQFKQLGIIRTRRADEKAGDLSLKEAEAAGFVVEKKR